MTTKRLEQKFPDVGLVSYLWFEFIGGGFLPMTQSILLKPDDDVYNFLASVTVGTMFRWQKEMVLDNVKLSLAQVRLQKVIRLNKEKKCRGKKVRKELEEMRGVDYWQQLLHKPDEFLLLVENDGEGTFQYVFLLPVGSDEAGVEELLYEKGGIKRLGKGVKEVALYAVKGGVSEVDFTPEGVKAYISRIFNVGSGI